MVRQFPRGKFSRISREFMELFAAFRSRMNFPLLLTINICSANWSVGRKETMIAREGVEALKLLHGRFFALEFLLRFREL